MIAIFICYFKIKSITVLHWTKTDSERYLNYRRHKNKKNKKRPKNSRDFSLTWNTNFIIYLIYLYIYIFFYSREKTPYHDKLFFTGFKNELGRRVGQTILISYMFTIGKSIKFLLRGVAVRFVDTLREQDFSSRVDYLWKFNSFG